MGRKRTQLTLTSEDRAAIARCLRAATGSRDQERARFALRAAAGTHTLEELARLTGRSRSTLQNWLARFLSGGLSALIRRDKAPGRQSRILETEIHSELRQGIQNRRWTTAQEIADWLQERHGVRMARKSVYYWLKKITPPSS